MFEERYADDDRVSVVVGDWFVKAEVNGEEDISVQ